MRRALVVLALIAAIPVLVAAPSGAQDDPNPVIIEDPQSDGGGIIPKPNSGTPPESATDRGGALQLTLLGLIVLFPIIAVVSVRRQSRKNQLTAQAGSGPAS